MSLADSHHRVRQAAVETFPKWGRALSPGPLIDLLLDANWEVRVAVAESIGRLRDPRAVDSLADLLGHSDPDLRRTAADALGHLADARAIGPLVKALIDEESQVRQAATKSLARIDPDWKRSASARDMIPYLEAAPLGKPYWIRVNAAESLAQIKGLPPPEPPLY